MNITQTLLYRDSGHRVTRGYDFAVKRLKCYDSGEYLGIAPSIHFSSDIPPVFACDFCTVTNNEHVLALANEDGEIAFQDTNIPSSQTCMQGMQAHHNAIFDLAWMKNEKKLVSAGGDHRAILWDVGESELQEIGRFEGHSRSVKTVAFKPEDKAVFATGARDGVIMIWDVRSNHGSCQYKPDNLIMNPHQGQGTSRGSSSRTKKIKALSVSRASSITGLVFQDDTNLISCGAGDGFIMVWDLRKNYSVYKRAPVPKFSLPYAGCTFKNGYTNLVMDSKRMQLYASCMDDIIYCFNMRGINTKPVATYTHHKNSTFYVKSCLSPDGQYLVSGSSDERAYIWNVDLPGRPIATLTGHMAEVTSVAWCPVGETKVVTISDDSRHRIWKVGRDIYNSNETKLNQDDGGRLVGWAEDFISTELIQGLIESGNSKCQVERTMSVLDRTPKSTKCLVLRQEKTPDVPSCGRNRPIPPKHPTCSSCREAGQGTTPCVTCLSEMNQDLRCKSIDKEAKQLVEGGSESRITKRKLDLMLPDSDESRDSAREEGTASSVRGVLLPFKKENDNKRRGSMGARRLFSPMRIQDLLEDEHSVDGFEDISQVPNKDCPNRPFKLFCHNIFTSPTLNLPNYVIDGTSPHHSCNRNAAHLKENVDWLTKLIKEKEHADSSTRAAKHRVPEKRQSRSGSKERNRKSRSSHDASKLINQKENTETLLRFFRVSGKSNSELSHCTSQSSPLNKPTGHEEDAT